MGIINIEIIEIAEDQRRTKEDCIYKIGISKEVYNPLVIFAIKIETVHFAVIEKLFFKIHKTNQPSPKTFHDLGVV